MLNSRSFISKVKRLNRFLYRGAAKKATQTNHPSQTSIGDGSSASYVEIMYNTWRKDPSCVHPVS